MNSWINSNMLWNGSDVIVSDNVTLNASVNTEATVAEVVRDVSLGFVLAFLSLLTFVGNAMVLHAVRTERRLQTVSNMFIVSLAIADLIVGLCVMPIGAIYIFTVDWLFGVAVCQFWIGIDYTASTASILNLFILSLDRYWSVTSPLKYIRKRTKKRALIMISLVWSGSCLWLIPIIGWHHFEHGGIRTVPANVCETEYATNTGLKIVTGILNYYLPLAFMYALYIKIFIEIHRRSLLEIGQRNVGSCVGSESIPVSGSLSDESGGDERNNSVSRTPDDHTMVISNHLVCFDRGSSLRVARNGGSWSSFKAMKMRQCDTTESDQTDCEHKQGYKLVKLTTGRTAESSDPVSSDSDCRTPYVYDELVCDSKSEKLHRFFYEECGVKSPRDSEEETALNGNGYLDNHHSSFASNSRVRFQMDASNNPRTQPALLPKEEHPNKNKYVKPRTLIRRSIPEVRLNSKPCSLHESSSYENVALKALPRNSVSKTAKNSPSVIKNNFVTTTRWKKKKRPKHRLKPSRALTKEIKAARQLGVILGAFTLCFFPYFVCFMVVAFCDSCISPDLMTAVTWVGYLNSTLNPFLYPLCNAAFRRKFRKMLNLKAPAKDIKKNSMYFTQNRSQINNQLHSGYSLVE